MKSERKDVVCTEGDDTVEGEEDCGGDDEHDGACGDLCTERALYLWCNMLVLVITCTDCSVVLERPPGGWRQVWLRIMISLTWI